MSSHMKKAKLKKANAGMAVKSTATPKPTVDSAKPKVYTPKTYVDKFGKTMKGVPPKPTTFKVELINSQDFNIIYVGKQNFTIKISGKKYNPNNLGELERASQSIADLLELNYAVEEGKEQSTADSLTMS